MVTSTRQNVAWPTGRFGAAKERDARHTNWQAVAAVVMLFGSVISIPKILNATDVQ